MDVFDKLKVLTNGAKYDVACTSSGVDRKAPPGGIGSSVAAGICHSFAGDGRCISLLKVLLSNACIYDCKYCVNRRSNDVPRATFSPRELADLVISFYRRNYIEGLFLSSGIVKNPDYTCEQMTEVLRLLREEYRFSGYIHAKAIPGADKALLARMGMWADRMSVNIELPSQQSLALLAPDKSKQAILEPMGFLTGRIRQSKAELVRYRAAPQFAPAGQSTQMIVGASPETDYQILNLSEGLYRRYGLKRVFYSAYMPVSDNPLLPSRETKPPLLREHRLYQADWLLRFYGFQACELLDDAHPQFNPYLDPKCNWALNHLDLFPVEVNRAPYEQLLRVPGIGVNSANRIMTARRVSVLDFAALKKLGVVLKRAQYFLLCKGRTAEGLKITHGAILRALMSSRALAMYRGNEPYAYETEQLSLFETPSPAPAGSNAFPVSIKEELQKCLTGQI